jgi:hypothetical protein
MVSSTDAPGLKSRSQGGAAEMDERERLFWLAFRRGLLTIVAAIERYIGLRPAVARKTEEEENSNNA